MPTTRRSRALDAAPEAVWRTVGDPHHLPRWWPMVDRVEQVDDEAFTELLRTAKGRGIRADFRITERREGAMLRYEQELEGSPFERLMRASETSVELDAAPEGTVVRITRRTRLRGMTSLGGFMWRRATARQIDEALDALEAIHA